MQDTIKTNPLYQQIGKNIAALRHSRKMTQEQLANLLHISVKHCSAVERGKSCLSLEKMITLCHTFQVSLDYLIEGKQPSEEKVPAYVADLFAHAGPQQREKLIRLLQLVQQL